MTINETGRIRKDKVGRVALDKVAAIAPVLAAVWCRSVGTSWAMELHQRDGGTAHGTVVDWITSGVPISQSEPDALACGLLAERGLQLFRNSSVGPCTYSRHGIGYACTNAELIKLAQVARDDAAEIGVDPTVLAAQWAAAGFSADAAASWIRAGIHSPQVAQQTARLELRVSQVLSRRCTMHSAFRALSTQPQKFRNT
jgi:hypothetical protein